MAADMVTAPIANALQETLLTDGDEAVREAVARWTRGTCPACGSWPALAEFFFGERLHRCAYCAAAWRIESRGCTYCGEHGEHFRTIPIDRGRPGKRLEVCRRCGGYLKTVDVASPTPFPLLAIEDFATADLDRAAAAHGFRRTALRTD
jgi:FdhE protein